MRKSQNAHSRLLVRVDDAGTSWASKMGCLRACTEGIARSVEVMMPGAWITHAGDLFNAHPQIDIGIHLTLTSEWDAVKWRPLTHAPSLVDETGAFLPALLPRAGQDVQDLKSADWSLQEVADELRAQVKYGTALFKQASHVSAHMIRHFADFDPRLAEVVTALCTEFGLKDDAFGHGLPRFAGYPAMPRDTQARVAAFKARISTLSAGTHIFIDHPMVESPEGAAMGHAGYLDVLQDRLTCLETLTDPGLKEHLSRSGVQVISYCGI